MLTLNQEEEVTGKIWEYLEGLPGDFFIGGGEVDPKHPELMQHCRVRRGSSVEAGKSTG